MIDVLFFDLLNIEKKESSLGILNLYTLIKSNYNVEILNCMDIDVFDVYSLQSYNEIIDEIVKRIVAKRPNILAINSLCSNYHFSLKIVDKVKEIYNVIVVYGGPQASSTAVESIQAFKNIDYIVMGESEIVFPILVENILTDKPIENIKGIVFRNNKGLAIRNIRDSPLLDLDKLPSVEFGDIFVNDYFPKIRIEVGRGCPFICTFCSTKIFWDKTFRTKPNEKIIDEIENLSKNYGIKFFDFDHDLFTFDRENIIDLCERIIEKKLNIFWGCSSRIDTLDIDMMKIMKNAGCRKIFFGVETVSEKIQKIINKSIKKQEVVNLVKMIEEVGEIKAVLAFMIGIPGEKVEDFIETTEFIDTIMEKSRNSVQLSFSKFTFLAGTEILEKYRDSLTLNVKHSQMNSNLFLDYSKKIIEEHKNIFPHFYDLKSEMSILASDMELFLSYFIYGNVSELLYVTFDLLKKHYNYNYITFLKEFLTYMNSIFIEINFFGSKIEVNSTKKNEYDFPIIIKNMKKFLSKVDFGELTNYIIDSFEVEKTILEISISSENVEKVYKLNTDYLLLRKTGVRSKTTDSLMIIKSEGKIEIKKLCS